MVDRPSTYSYLEIQITVVEVIDPPWRGDVTKVTSIEIQISVGEVIEGRGGARQLRGK